MTIPYKVGQITLTNNSIAVLGVGTSWATAQIAGGTIYVEANGNALPIEVVTDNTHIVASVKWTGASGTYNYALVIESLTTTQLLRTSTISAQLFAELQAGTLFKYDVAAAFSQRSTYNERQQGFAFLAIDTVPARLYIKNSGTSGDWAGPFQYGQGERGIQGPVGFLAWKGTYSGATAYVLNDGVYQNGSAWVCISPTTGNAPPTLPTTANTWWSLLAAKGQDGTGVGDVQGPASAVDNRLVRFSGTTGKFIKDGGATIAQSEVATLVSDLAAKFAASGGILKDTTAPTKTAKFDLSELTAPSVRTITLADRDVVLNPAWELIEDATFTSFFTWSRNDLGAYKRLRLAFNGANLTTAAVFVVQVSYDNGATWVSGASDYFMQNMYGTSSSVGAVVQSLTSIQPSFTNLISPSAAGFGLVFRLDIEEFNKNKSMVCHLWSDYQISPSGSVVTTSAYAHSGVGSARNAIRIVTGQAARGSILLEGMRG